MDVRAVISDVPGNALKMALESMGRYSLGPAWQEDVVRKWQERTPDGRKVDCHRETGLSRVTITKYWKSRER